VPANQASQASDPVMSVDRAGLASDPAMSVDLADLVSDPAISVDRAAQVRGHFDRATESMHRICPVAFAIGINGRIGEGITATKSATIGATMPATTTIGTATNGGSITTSTISTTPGSITGLGLPGRR
jgi:hypothetical protein